MYGRAPPLPSANYLFHWVYRRVACRKALGMFYHTTPKLPTVGKVGRCDPQTAQYLKYLVMVILELQHLPSNIRESSSTFNPTSRGDCSIFLCVIFKRYTFSCGKKEWPAGRAAGTRGNCDLTRVTLLPSMPSCAQSFWHP